MAESVHAAPSQEQPEPESESVDVRRFPHLVEGARALGPEDQRALALEINTLLVAMRSPGHEPAEAKVLLETLDAHHLDGLVDPQGRSCRKEAVETLLACGFPHALSVNPEDLEFARTWVPTPEDLAGPWEEQLTRARRNGAALVLGGELLALVTGLVLAPLNGVAIGVEVTAGLAACLAALSFARSEPTLEGQSKWATALVMCALVQLLAAFSVGPAGLIGAVAVIAGCWMALSGQVQPLEDRPQPPDPAERY